MMGSTVTVFAVNSDGSNGATLGSGTTDGTGNFDVSITSPSGAVRLTASGGSYVSEMNGATISSPATISEVILAPTDGQSGISINPLTDFVNSMAVAMAAAGTPFDTALTNASAKIESYYGLKTDPGMLVPDYTKAGVGTDAGNLGLVLGAIINEDQYLCPSSPGGLVTALSADISDGVFDGMKAGTAVPYCGGNLAAIAGTAQFQDALSALRQLGFVIAPFIFGGTNNILTLNGLANIALGVSPVEIYPLAAINSALIQAAPPVQNKLAPAAETASMNVGRGFASEVTLPSGKVLIAGGLTLNNDVSSTELYDPAANTFAAAAATATMNVARDSATITLLSNGKVLIAGGFNTTVFHAIASTELYDPATNTFAPPAGTASMNEARYNATATLLPNGKVLIAGGVDVVGNQVASTELYDSATNTFAPPSGTATMNRPRTEASAVLLPNGSVLIAGGYNDADTELASTELYNPVTNSFAPAAETATMNNLHDIGTATLLPNGKVLVAGGYISTSDLTDAVDLYDPATNTFAPASSTPTMNVARGEDVAVLLPNGNVLIAGGWDGSNDLASTELYDTATNTFAPASGTVTMNSVRDYPTGGLLINGKVLIAGGFGTITINASTDLYTP
jgi:hypothetical protein